MTSIDPTVLPVEDDQAPCDPCSGEASPPATARGILGIGLVVLFVLAPWVVLSLAAVLLWRLFG